VHYYFDIMMMSSSLQVVWFSRSERPRSFVVDSDVLHYVIKEGLTRLTQYTVYVYAVNGRGKGSDSQRVNITTDAVGRWTVVAVCMYMYMYM
jgi:hypothetical protein